MAGAGSDGSQRVVDSVTASNEESNSRQSCVAGVLATGSGVTRLRPSQPAMCPFVFAGVGAVGYIYGEADKRG